MWAAALILIATSLPQSTESRVTLPAAVRSAFETAYPGATISSVIEEHDARRRLFRVEGVHRGRRRIVLYDVSGVVIEVAEQIEERELPQPVAAAMRSHRRAIYVSGLKVTRGGVVEYRLTLRGTRKTAMVAKPDGTVVSFQ